jgi:hypothetical protein
MNKTLSDGVRQSHVDGLLQSFFHSEVPDAWPEANVPLPAHAVRRSWFRSYGRAVLAASVGLILLGYLTLAASFPKEAAPGPHMDRGRTIGSNFGISKQRVPTPHGGEAFLWEETIPGEKPERPTIIIKVQEITSPKKR